MQGKVFMFPSFLRWRLSRCLSDFKKKKNPPANAGDAEETGSIPGSGRSPGGGYGNLLQYSYLENSIDRGAWETTVHGVAKIQA